MTKNNLHVENDKIFTEYISLKRHIVFKEKQVNDYLHMHDLQ